jgi:glycosyltransferase involved in cell wall biosynthesis
LRTRSYLKRTSGIVAVSASIADVLRDRFAVPSSRIWIVPPGASADRFAAPSDDDRRAARKALGLDGDDPVAVFVGALSPEKDVGTAIRAVAALDGVRLAVVGEGPDRSMLESLAERIAPSRVTFLGSLPSPILPFTAADVAVLPSASEGVPAVLIEAAFTGLPAVATNVGAVADVVKHGRTGMLVPPGDVDAFARALSVVVEDRYRLGRSARDYCLATFEMSVVAAEWDRILEGFGAWPHRN